MIKVTIVRLTALLVSISMSWYAFVGAGEPDFTVPTKSFFKSLGLRSCDITGEYHAGLVITDVKVPLSNPASEEPGRNIKGYCEARQKTDRYGHPVAQIVEDGVWWQKRLVQKGEAVVFSRYGETKAIKFLKRLETCARRGGLGLWSDQGHIINYPEQKIIDDPNRFQIIQARVLSVGKTRRRHYLNFGPYWKTDLTAEISSSIAKKLNFQSSTFDQKNVELRGYFLNKNGPSIQITKLGQISLPPDENKAAAGINHPPQPIICNP